MQERSTSALREAQGLTMDISGYIIIEISATSLAHNAVLIGSSNFHLQVQGRYLGQIDHNLHDHFLMMSYANQ